VPIRVFKVYRVSFCSQHYCPARLKKQMYLLKENHLC